MCLKGSGEKLLKLGAQLKRPEMLDVVFFHGTILLFALSLSLGAHTYAHILVSWKHVIVIVNCYFRVIQRSHIVSDAHFCYFKG